ELTGKLAREHNNANVLCLGGRTTSKDKAVKIIDSFLAAEFEGSKPQGQRHLRRVEEISEMEN
ncbi:MAG: RpiB/LacA/LacB family sugar-phosphate isomerase, partial [Candidatus Diapherotrites archaeon]|nr:RpiB/LacA/LacB family sugar-phosphate isomerase [Candidatus Diapherotrites archaeon]